MRKLGLIIFCVFSLVQSPLMAQIQYPDSASVQLNTDELFWDFDTRKNDTNPALSYGPDGPVIFSLSNDSVYMTFGVPENTITYSAFTLDNLKGGGTYEVVRSGASAGNYPGSSDPNPGNFDYKIWPAANGGTGAAAFQGTDGHLYRVQYQEFWGWEIDSLVNNNVCPDPQVVTSLEAGLEKCWYNGFVLTKSTDGGNTWNLAGSTPADYVVASSPYKLREQNNTTRHGVFPWNESDSYSRVFKIGTYYYFPVEFWGQGFRISTIMRTSDISDAQSWRYWDGSDFTIPNVNPYYDTVTDPASHLPPSLQGSGELDINAAKAAIEGLPYSSYFGKYIRTRVRAYSSNPEIIPGVYYHLSEDGFNWSGPQLLYRLSYASEMNSNVEVGGRSENIAYPMLVDATNPGTGTYGQNVWMFYVTFNPANSGAPDRNIRRVKIDFSTRSVNGFTVTHKNLNLPEDASPGDGYCDNGFGRCSFITAINEANSRPPWVSGDSALTITFDSSLSDSVNEDYASTISKKIIIDGSGHSGFTQNSLHPEEGNNAVYPFVLGSGLVFSGSGHEMKNVHVSHVTVGGENTTGNVRMTGSRVGALSLYGTTEVHSVIGGTAASDANLFGSVTMLGVADTLRGNLIGMDGTGTAIVDPSFAFVTIGNNGNVVDQNVMGETDYRGINIPNGTGNTISGNVIGVAPWDGSDHGTGGAGISVNTNDNLITGNTIGFTKGEAAIVVGDVFGNTMTGNYIGTNASGANYGNSTSGIWITGTASNNTVGNADGTAPNVIANNTGAGVDFLVLQGSGNTVTTNLIYDNAGGAIANYTHLDVAAPPDLYSAYINDTADSLYFYVTDTDSLENMSTYRLELYLADSSAEQAQGNVYLGAIEQPIESGSRIPFALGGTEDLSVNADLSFTVIDENGNTSVFAEPKEIFSSTQTPTAELNVSSMSTVHNDQKRSETIAILLTNSGNKELDWFMDNEQSWAFAEPDQGTLGANDSLLIGITFDSREFDSSLVVRDTLYLRSDAVGQPGIVIPVEIDLTVGTAIPNIAFETDTLEYTYSKTPTDQIYTETFHVVNLGAGGLSWMITKNQPWINGMNPAGGVMGAGDTTAIDLELKVRSSTTVGTYEGILVVFGNYGGDNVPFELFVKMHVVDGQEPPPPVGPSVQFNYPSDTLFVQKDSVELQFEVSNFILGSDPENSNGYLKVYKDSIDYLMQYSQEPIMMRNLKLGLQAIQLQLFHHNGSMVNGGSDVQFIRYEEGQGGIQSGVAFSATSDTVQVEADSVLIEFQLIEFVLGHNASNSNGYMKVYLNGDDVMTRNEKESFVVHNLLSGLNEIILQLFGHDDQAVPGGSDTLYVENTLLPDALEEELPIPDEFKLSQNYPNPFNPNTQIQYALSEAAQVQLTVYDALGREIAVLTEGYKSAGTYQVNFQAQNLSSGMYFYELKAGDYRKIRKMILMK